MLGEYNSGAMYCAMSYQGFDPGEKWKIGITECGDYEIVLQDGDSIFFAMEEVEILIGMLSALLPTAQRMYAHANAKQNTAR